MNYHPVVDRFAAPVPLDPLSATFFTAAFVAAALVTARRPAYGLAALFVAMPFDFGREIFATTITLPKCVLLGVLLGASTYAGCGALLRRQPAPLLLAALGLLLAVTALTAIGAVHRGLVVREALKIVEYAALFVAAFLCRSLDTDDAPPIAALAIAAIAVAISALLQEIVGAPSGLFIGPAIVPRIAGVLEGPNQLSAYCEVSVAALGAWALVRRTPLIAAALGLMVFADVLTFSRAGWVALAVVAALLVIAGGRRAWAALQPGLAGLVAGAAGALAWGIYARTPGILRASLESSAYAGGVGNRDQLWSAAWRMWLAHPLLGVGAGNFEALLPAYGVLGIRTHANSWYLQALAEGGILLFAATLALLAAIVAGLHRGRLLPWLRETSPWAVAALAATVALALHQTVDYLVFYPKVGGAWWLLIGTAAAAIAARM